MRYNTLATFLFRQSNTRPLAQCYRRHARPYIAFQHRHLQTVTEPMGNRTRSAAPLETYDNTATLYDDPYQRAVVKHLNKLWHLLKDYEPHHNTKDQSIRSQLAKEDAPRSIYIYGSVGTGKTMVMDLFYSTLPTPYKKRVHYHELMLDVHARIHALNSSKSKGKKQHPLSQIADDLASNTCILCLDEFQVTDIADAMLLRQLVDALIDRGVVLVTTSNRHPTSLYENGHHRLLFYPCIRRIMNDFTVLCLDGGVDYRRAFRMFEGEQYNDNDAFLYPLDESTRERMNDQLRQLTNNQPMAPLVVDLLNRTARIPAHVDGVGAARFSDLCSEALSAADYLALVRNLHTLVLTDIPAVMERVEVRRFITLIDALYESRIRLYASAECAVEDLCFKPDPESQEMLLMGQQSSLFTGEEETFALQRALSRLIEMQTRQWMTRRT
ncbi:lactation elevated protein 1 [Lichtheimia corymbifera JMRC:FSU:9682]|uniref:Lactation elevated protein 1 n=1 Tax=Lichtheimia corymbifera JMRC:FSU:9682 TaxID=1263082 RepID=A0A068S971_9FUNG|nr:lactation elevated protein 1 [Lichtheimia corymbifera JMRC:FSU:9682]